MSYAYARIAATAKLTELRTLLSQLEKAADQTGDQPTQEAVADAWEWTERLASCLADCVASDEDVTVPAHVARDYDALGYDLTGEPTEILLRLLALAQPVEGDPGLYRVRPGLLRRGLTGRLELRVKDGVMVSVRDKDSPANDRRHRR